MLLLHLNTWELLSIMMIDKTVDDAMVLLSKENCEKKADEFPFDASHIKRLVKEFLPVHPDIEPVEGFSQVSTDQDLNDWPEPGNVLELVIKEHNFHAKQNEAIWLVVNQNYHDKYVVDKHSRNNVLLQCFLVDTSVERVKPSDHRLLPGRRRLHVKVEVIQSIPFRDFWKYFPCPESSLATWREHIEHDACEKWWKNYSLNFDAHIDSDDDSDDSDDSSVRSEASPYYKIQIRVLRGDDLGQEFRFIQINSNWYCFMIMNFAHPWRYEFKCHLFRVPASDVLLFDLEKPDPGRQLQRQLPLRDRFRAQRDRIRARRLDLENANPGPLSLQWWRDRGTRSSPYHRRQEEVESLADEYSGIAEGEIE